MADQPVEFPPTGGLLYKVIGADVNEPEFVNRAAALSKTKPQEFNMLQSVCVRLEFIDYFTRVMYDHSVRIRFHTEALEVYLLCTCIDALASASSIPFDVWLETGKQEYQPEERALRIAELTKELSYPVTAEEFKHAAKELYGCFLHELGGLSRRFVRFFTEIPEALAKRLIPSYMISKEFPLTREAYEQWSSRCDKDKLEAVAKYLYKYRRSAFTHKARSEPAARPMWPEEAIRKGEIGGEERPFTLKTFFKDDDPDKESELYVLFADDEALLLREVVVARCRMLLDLPVDQGWLANYRKYQQQRIGLFQFLAECLRNYRTLEYYGLDWNLDWNPDNYYLELPAFLTDWAAYVEEQCDLSVYLTVEDMLRDWLRQYRRSLVALNEGIAQFNQTYPSSSSNYEQRLHVKRALFHQLRKMQEFGDARYWTWTLLGEFERILQRTPVST